jgi:hypothetical protein
MAWTFIQIILYIVVPTLVGIAITLGIIAWRRWRVDNRPTTIIFSFDPSGLTEPIKINPSDESPSFVRYMQADGSVIYARKPRKMLTLPDKKDRTWIRAAFVPRGGISSVEVDEYFGDFVPTDEPAVDETVNDEYSELHDLTRGFHGTPPIGTKGVIVFVAAAIIGLMFGLILGGVGHLHLNLQLMIDTARSIIGK